MERTLSDRLKRGEQSALAEVYHLWGDKLFALLLRYVGDRDRAADLLQDCMLKIYRECHRFHWRGAGSLEAWVTRVCVNAALSRLRADSRHPRTSLEEIEIPAEYVEEASETAWNIDYETLLGLIAALPNGYRAVFNLFVFEQYSHNDIAKALGISVRTSQSQLLRARRLLAKWIQEYNTHG